MPHARVRSSDSNVRVREDPFPRLSLPLSLSHSLSLYIYISPTTNLFVALPSTNPASDHAPSPLLQLLCALGNAPLQWAALTCAAALAFAAIVQNVYRPLAASAGRQLPPLLGAIAVQFAVLALAIKLAFFGAR